MESIGAFCEAYGASIRNRVLEYLLENQDLDIAIGDLARETGISRPAAYGVISEFEGKGYVRKSRVVGKTQFYLLDRHDKRVRMFLRNFRDCLRIVAEDESENDGQNNEQKEEDSLRCSRDRQKANVLTCATGSIRG